MKSGCCIGVDLGGTKTCILIAGPEGETLCERYTTTRADPGALAVQVGGCIRQAGLCEADVDAMGIGVAGRVDPVRGVVLDAPALYWLEYPLLEKLAGLFPFPVFINNDVRMALMGERTSPGYRDVDDMAFVSIGTGLGCAFLSGGHILSGADNSAGEVGYLITDGDLKHGMLNSQNAFGTTEARVSGSALDQQAQVLGMSNGQLFEEYANGGAPAAAVDRFVDALCVVIANIVSMLNPRLVVLGGGVSNSLHGLLPAINQKVATLTPIHTQVCISRLGNRAGAVGACVYGRACVNKEAVS